MCIRDSINTAIAGYIFHHTSKTLKVDVHHPEILVKVELRKDYTYVMDLSLIHISIMYDPSTNEFKGVGFKSNTNINEMDSKDFIAICAIISSNVDESLKNNDKQSLKNILECFESAITYNGYVYFIDTNDGITFMIYPKGSF